MKGKVKNICDSRLVGLFHDLELDEADEALVREHVATCPSCQSELKRLQFLSTACKINKCGLAKEEQLHGLASSVLGRMKERDKPFGRRLLEGIFSRKALIPGFSMAFAAIIFFSHGTFLSPPTGPSAIISSFSGDVSSVIMMETPKTRQTIIWITED